MDGSSNRRNKASFSNFTGVVWILMNGLGQKQVLSNVIVTKICDK